MSTNNPLVSILIANYNNEKFLSRSINSCLNQSYTNFEIIIFDDKSTDNSKSILQSYEKNDKIKIFFNDQEKKNVPALDAANSYFNAFKKSSGSIISLLDSDDYFDNNKILKIVEFFERRRSKDLVQNLPAISYSDKFKKKLNRNNFLSFMPYFAPESCISFRRKLMSDFLASNDKFYSKYNDVWLGFRLEVFAYYCLRKFGSLNKHLTFYESLGESKKYSFFKKNWMNRRMNSFEFLLEISSKNGDYRSNFEYYRSKHFGLFYKLDYTFTKLLTKIYNFILK